MNSNETRTLWISVGAALFAIFLLYSWSQEQKSMLSRQFGTSKRVIVAAKDIADLETLDASKVEVVERPVDFIEPEALTDPEIAVGQVAAAPIKKGEQILQTKLLLPGPETGLAMEVTPGKRAITIPVDDMRGVSRLLRPGDRIDLIAALDVGKGPDARREVRTLLQDVVVLATGLSVVNKLPRVFEVDPNAKGITQYNLKSNSNFSTITIEAKPEEVQQLVYILSTSPGSLFSVLRHPNDRFVNPPRITGIDDVLGRYSGGAGAAAVRGLSGLSTGALPSALPGAGSAGQQFPTLPGAGANLPSREESSSASSSNLRGGSNKARGNNAPRRRSSKGGGRFEEL